jgi:predicted nucleic acid-binding protein
LADAVSFAVIKRRGIGAAIAQDRHFMTAGFETMPASAAQGRRQR